MIGQRLVDQKTTKIACRVVAVGGGVKKVIVWPCGSEVAHLF
jgi:hypothetical protein